MYVLFRSDSPIFTCMLLANKLAEKLMLYQTVTVALLSIDRPLGYEKTMPSHHVRTWRM